MALEFKVVPLSDMKTAGEPTGEMRFSGYGAVFGNIDAHDDVIEKGAFAATLEKSKASNIYPSMLLQHGGWGMNAQDLTPIGVWDTLAEDDIGLKSEGILAPTVRGIEAYALMKMAPRPAITGLSIGYRVKRCTLGTAPGEPARLIHELELEEISLVTFPSNPLSRVTGVKSEGEMTEREFERFLRDAGLSRKEANMVFEKGFRYFLAQRDAGVKGYSELEAAIRKNIELFNPS